MPEPTTMREFRTTGGLGQIARRRDRDEAIAAGHGIRLGAAPTPLNRLAPGDLAWIRLQATEAREAVRVRRARRDDTAS